VLALRFFAKPIVILAEIAKITILIIMGIYQVHVPTRVVCWVLAALFLVYDIWARKKLMLAARIIEYSTKAMKANPSIFIGSVAIKLYLLEMLLYLFIFSQNLLKLLKYAVFHQNTTAESLIIIAHLLAQIMFEE
jgi:hypothetical protein